MQIKTIDVNAKEWFDKINGNSYFSAIITLNYGMKTDATIKLPFQYGYESHYLDMAVKELADRKLIKVDKRTSLWAWCEDNNVILRYSKLENCLKRDL